MGEETGLDNGGSNGDTVEGIQLGHVWEQKRQGFLRSIVNDEGKS